MFILIFPNDSIFICETWKQSDIYPYSYVMFNVSIFYVIKISVYETTPQIC